MSIFRKKSELGLYLDRRQLKYTKFPSEEQIREKSIEKEKQNINNATDKVRAGAKISIPHTCNKRKLNKYNSDLIIWKRTYNNISDIPKKSGVYVFITRQGYVYIGRSKNVYSRIHAHNLNYNINKVIYMETDTEDDERELKEKMIKEFCPELNK